MAKFDLRRLSLAEWLLYNQELPHQSLVNETPNRIHESAQGGGALKQRGSAVQL